MWLVAVALVAEVCVAEWVGLVAVLAEVGVLTSEAALVLPVEREREREGVTVKNPGSSLTYCVQCKPIKLLFMIRECSVTYKRNQMLMTETHTFLQTWIVECWVLRVP